MYKFTLLHLSLLFLPLLYGRDDFKPSAGNNLFPLQATKIVLYKQVLTIKQTTRYGYTVEAYYEFMNPGNAQNIDVGFEEFPPVYDYIPQYKKYTNPKINFFSIVMNGQATPHAVSICKTENYYANGKFLNVSHLKAREDKKARYTYFYHFNAHFKKGLNTIKHSYTIRGIGFDNTFEFFDYDFSNASAWANGKIDYFSLELDLGTFKNFEIFRTFFNSSNEWTIVGAGVKKDSNYMKFDSESTGLLGPDGKDTVTQFVMRKGSIHFNAHNFNPRSSLMIISTEPNFLMFHFDDGGWDHHKNKLAFEACISNFEDTLPVLAASLKILQNFPYARRGYISPDKEIQSYYESLAWYWPDPGFIANEAFLNEEEKKWLESLFVVKE